MKKYLVLGAVLALAGCSNDPNGHPYVVDYVITDVSFQEAHVEHHGKSHDDIPDRWWVNFCNVKKADDCTNRAVQHAPWKWQHVGQKVSFTWQPRARYDTIEQVVLDTGEVVGW
jgi:hypothetical protein